MVEVDNIIKSFDKNRVLQGVSFTAKKGELYSLLGPSGCGKSTLLRIIAGLEKEESGSISYNGEKWNNILPENRNIGMVFQQYSLWPHMTVAENIGYGLKLRKVNNAEISKKVNEVLNLVGLTGFNSRKPGTLSGGEQQRAALARALVLDSKLILLDEPLSNLDAKMRVELRHEIRKLQQNLGLTMIYVTHDQEEAMAISDQIALLHLGKIIQQGTPEEIYNYPKTIFAASFFGKSSLLDTSFISDTDQTITVSLGKEQLTIKKIEKTSYKKEDKIKLVIKPNAVSIGTIDNCKFSGKIIGQEFQGIHYAVLIKTANGIIQMFNEERKFNINDTVFFSLKENLLTVVQNG